MASVQRFEMSTPAYQSIDVSGTGTPASNSSRTSKAAKIVLAVVVVASFSGALMYNSEPATEGSPPPPTEHHRPSPGNPPHHPLETAAGPVGGGAAIVSAIWILMYLSFMPLGPTAKAAQKTPGQIAWGERTFLNMLEQAPGFFASLWIHSFYVSDASATALGVMYLCLRACYPVIWAVKGGENGNGQPFMWHFTFTQYGIIIYMTITTILKVGFDIDFTDFFGSYSTLADVGLAFVVGKMFQTFVFKIFFKWTVEVFPKNFGT